MSAWTTSVYAQTLPQDTLLHNELEGIEILSNGKNGTLNFLDDVNANRILSGRKTALLYVGHLQADLSTNSSRQVFAKVAGIHIWESDASGIQTNISSRGLSPNRSWEINMRQNGFDISSDVFGYPEAYYTPPLEAVENIEVVRGSASLQYGPQFGGLINYQLRKPKLNTPIHVQLNSTVGSYGLHDEFMSLQVGGKKWAMLGWFQNRAADGWRENSAFNTQAGHVHLLFAPNTKMQMGIEVTRSNFEQQQPGGLTDSLFHANPRMSNRARNWMSNPWNLANAYFKHRVSASFQYEWNVFGLLAERNSIGFLQTALVNDVADSLGFAKRQVDRDFYTNWGTELRATYSYNIAGKSATLAFGGRAYHANTKRLQRGTGDRGSDFNTWVDANGYRSRLNFGTSNFAAFAEQLVRLNDKWSITPGVRLENITNTGSGTVNFANGWVTSGKRTRTIVLGGITTAYKFSESIELYANASQAFRPVTFSELTPSSTTEVVDANLKDSKGASADLGIRGKTAFGLVYDVTAFYLSYQNRIGTYLVNGANYKTNIGNSRSAGIESFAEMTFYKNELQKTEISAYINYSFTQANYTSWSDPEVKNDRTGKHVENVPKHIARYGLNAKWKQLRVALMGNYVDAVYTDAMNTETPNATATIGRINAYRVFDASISWKPSERISITGGANNMTNAVYATRRSAGYPGPGLLPSNGRTFFVTVIVSATAKKKAH
jgi:Fe(3+) dicitrate transport protein